MFSNQDLKNLIVPLFLEQLLMALVGMADVFVIGFVGAAASQLVTASALFSVTISAALLCTGASLMRLLFGRCITTCS